MQRKRLPAPKRSIRANPARNKYAAVSRLVPLGAKSPTVKEYAVTCRNPHRANNDRTTSRMPFAAGQYIAHQGEVREALTGRDNRGRFEVKAIPTPVHPCRNPNHEADHTGGSCKAEATTIASFDAPALAD